MMIIFLGEDPLWKYSTPYSKTRIILGIILTILGIISFVIGLYLGLNNYPTLGTILIGLFIVMDTVGLTLCVI